MDLAAEAAFAGHDARALRNNPRLIDMGRWSDGWLVRLLIAEIPRVEGQGAPKLEPGSRRRLCIRSAALILTEGCSPFRDSRGNRPDGPAFLSRTLRTAEGGGASTGGAQA